MKIALPTVGPILGYTTHSEARIWLRGDFQIVDGRARRCYGVVQYREKGTAQWSDMLLNKLEPHFDFTGVFVLTGLKPRTGYEYRAGWFFADADLDGVAKMTQAISEWPVQHLEFRSGSSNASEQRSYAVGSCRYLLRLFGGTIFDERGDKCFRSIFEQHAQRPLDGMLMIGDQIYADDLKHFGKDVNVDDFLERYRLVFSQEHIQTLMARLPTYMILDDHEIEDNWPSEAAPKDRLTMYPHAVHAYQIYQCSHSPIFNATANGRLSGTLPHFWYKFSDGCADWFVMDVRTERELGRKKSAQIINDAQMQSLLEWLVDGSGRTKFVVSSVPFIPDLKSDADDKWGAFVDQRDEIISHILDHRVQKVVFVSGDVHCSFTCQLELAGEPDFKVLQVVSSSFFWPYPHMGERDFAFGQKIASNTGKAYTVKLTSKVHADDNFARIDASTEDINVSFFSRKGEMLDIPTRLPYRRLNIQ